MIHKHSKIKILTINLELSQSSEGYEKYPYKWLKNKIISMIFFDMSSQ